jgi:MarR family transcriptional regulator, organic hydroperoxide resistance regulator
MGVDRSQSEPGLSHGELAERLFAQRSTVSGIVDRLEDRGVVARETDPDDRPLGRRLVKKSPPPVQLGLRRALEDLPTPQLRRLRRILQSVVQRTAAADIDAPFFDIGSAPRPRRKHRTPKRRT